MTHSPYRPATRMLLGGLLAVAVPTAVAQGQKPKVDFEEETHFRCYIVSQQTPQPATPVTLTDQFLENVSIEIDEPLQFCAPVGKNVPTTDRAAGAKIRRAMSKNAGAIRARPKAQPRSRGRAPRRGSRRPRGGRSADAVLVTNG